MVRTTFGGRYDKKYQVFGDSQQEPNDIEYVYVSCLLMLSRFEFVSS